MDRGSPIETEIRLRLPVDLRTTLRPHRRGRGDPVWRTDPDGTWWQARPTPAGPAALAYRQAGDGSVHVRAWGPGAGEALAAAPAMLGSGDDLEGFCPTGLVGELHRRNPGLRIGRSGTVFVSFVPTVLEQKVTGKEAHDAYRGLVRSVGERAPGPVDLRLPPTPEAVAAMPAWAFHPLGVEGRRAGVIRFGASRAKRLEEAAAMPLPEARARLLAFPGVGPWTAAEVALTALGDPDAVSVGDFHLPNLVAWALAGEPRGTDERMLELLEPFAGHRGRALRLLELAGMAAPRFGPRLALRSIERI